MRTSRGEIISQRCSLPARWRLKIMDKFLLFRKKSSSNTTRDGEAEDGLVNSQTCVGVTMVKHQGDGGGTVEFSFLYFPLENKSNHGHQKSVYIYSIRSKATAFLTEY